jgi:hypothetical protein
LVSQDRRHPFVTPCPGAYSVHLQKCNVYLRISGISIYRRDGLLKDSVYSHEQLIFQRQGDLKEVDLIEKETEVVTNPAEIPNDLLRYSFLTNERGIC